MMCIVLDASRSCGHVLLYINVIVSTNPESNTATGALTPSDVEFGIDRPETQSICFAIIKPLRARALSLGPLNVCASAYSYTQSISCVCSDRPSFRLSGSQHLPEGASPPQGDRLHTSLAMDRCAKGEDSVWVNPGGGDRRYSG